MKPAISAGGICALFFSSSSSSSFFFCVFGWHLGMIGMENIHNACECLLHSYVSHFHYLFSFKIADVLQLCLGCVLGRVGGGWQSKSLTDARGHKIDSA